MPNLLVSVASVAIEQAKASDDFPTEVGQPKIHTAVTKNKPAGACESEAKQYTSATVSTDL